MLLIINMISLCAHIYSVEYMSVDVHITRFFSYLSLFTFFMLLLVLSDNLLQLFVGWEGVGICSYLLINFWFTRIQANKSAILAVMVNKLGDIALLLCCVALQYLYKSVTLATVALSTCSAFYITCTVDVMFEHFIANFGMFDMFCISSDLIFLPIYILNTNVVSHVFYICDLYV